MAKSDVTLIAGYAGEFEQALIRRAMLGLDVAQDTMLKEMVKDKYTLTKLLVNGQIEPYSGVFQNEDGDLEYEPRTFTTGVLQRDITLDPEDYRDTWMQKEISSNAKDLKIPFAQFVLDTIIAANFEQLNTMTAWGGVGKAAATWPLWAVGTVYTAGQRVRYVVGSKTYYYKANQTTTAGDLPTTAKFDRVNPEAITIGFQKQIADALTAGSTTAFATGALDKTTAYDAQVALFRSLPKAIQAKGAIIYQSFTDYDALVDNIETSVTKNFEIIDGVAYLPKTDRKCIVKRCSWINSRRLIASADQNLVTIMDMRNDHFQLKPVEKEYTTNLALKATIGFGIRDLDALKVSNQA